MASALRELRLKAGARCLPAFLLAVAAFAALARVGGAQGSDGTGEAVRIPATTANGDDELGSASEATLLDASPKGEVLELDSRMNVQPGSLDCDGERVWGTLTDSSAGLPSEVVSGTVVAAAHLECLGADGTVLPHMLRAIVSVEHTPGTTSFQLFTHNLASSTCEASTRVHISPDGPQVCVQKEELPMANLRTSSVRTSGYTHSLSLNIVEADLNLMSMPGVTVEDVFLVYNVARNSDTASDPPCDSSRRIGVLPGMVFLTAPFYFCAKVCPGDGLAPYVQQSPCLSVTFTRPANVPDEDEERYREDSPLNFVEEGSDPLKDALKELAKQDEESYRLSRSEIGLIVSTVVCSVLFVVIGFVVVCKYTSFSQRAAMISPYLRAAGAAAPAATATSANASGYTLPPPVAVGLTTGAQSSAYVTHHVAPSRPSGAQTPKTPGTVKHTGNVPPLKYSQAAMASPRFATVVGTPKASGKRVRELHPQSSLQPSRTAEKRQTGDSV
mmetsp:Transcript_12797/g.32289  ORF Transcript_12797/g.32289 Transcript_12797/m.32289 type:complete len:501 (+) Transcript_12797:288-1790(+)